MLLNKENSEIGFENSELLAPFLLLYKKTCFPPPYSNYSLKPQFYNLVDDLQSVSFLGFCLSVCWGIRI